MNARNHVTGTLCVLLTLIALCRAFAQSYKVDWNCVSSGSEVMSSDSYRVSATVDQPVAGFSKNTSFLHWIGFWSADVPVPTVVPTIRDAKLLADRTFVSVSGKIATSTEGDYSGFFYLEESNRLTGIRVVFPVGAVSGLVRGKSVVNVLGNMGTTPAGERQITASVIVITSTNQIALRPLGMMNRLIGGGDFGTPPLGQYGTVGCTGVSNVGLFIKTWGRVSYVDSSYMLISDGSVGPVKVDTSTLSVLPAKDDYIGIVGISSLRVVGPDRLPLLLPLGNADHYYP